MALIITGQPQAIHPAYNPSQLWLFLQPNINLQIDFKDVPGFRYVYELYDGNDTLINTFKVPKQLNGQGFLDLSKYLQNYLSENIDFNSSTWRFADNKQIFDYKVKCGFSALQFTRIISVTDSSGAIRLICDIPVPFNVGDTVELQTNNTNLLPIRTVTSVGTIVGTPTTYYFEIDQDYASLGPSPVVEGFSYFSDRRIVTVMGNLSDPDNPLSPRVPLVFEGAAYNEAISFQKFPSFDTNRIQLLPTTTEPDLQRILTNTPRTGFKIKPYQRMWWNFMHAQDEGVNCIFFENSNGELYRMNTNSPNNDQHYIKQVDVSPSGNFLLTGSASFPKIKPDTKWYDVWAESSCCAEFCETLDVNFTVSGSTSPAVIDGDYIFVATNTGDEFNGKPIWQFEGTFNPDAPTPTTFTAYIRWSDTLINTWEMYTIDPITSEEVIFATQNDANCWIFSYCLEIPCAIINFTFVIAGDTYTLTVNPSGWDAENEKFIYNGTFDNGIPYIGTDISVNGTPDRFKVIWNESTERWEMRAINPGTGGSTGTTITNTTLIAFTTEDLCDETVWEEPEIDCGETGTWRFLHIRIDGELATMVRTASNNYYVTFTPLYFGPGDSRNGKYCVFYDPSGMDPLGWSMCKGNTPGEGDTLFHIPGSLVEDCPFQEEWEPFVVDDITVFSTYEFYEGVDSTTSPTTECDSINVDRDLDGNYNFTLTNQYLPGFEGNYTVTTTTIAGIDYWVLLDDNTNIEVAITPKTGNTPPLSTEWTMSEIPNEIVSFFSDFRCPDENTCPHNVSYEYVFEPNVYTEITTESSCSGEAQTRTSEKIRVYIDHECSINEIQLLFQDRSGSWSSFAFPLRVEESGTMEKKSYRQTIGGLQSGNSLQPFNGPGYNYSLSENERPVYHSKVEKTYKLSTDWITDEMSLYFEELLTSPNIYINFGDYNEDYYPTSNPWLACEIIDSNFVTPRAKNKKLIRREVTIKLSSNNIINV